MTLAPPPGPDAPALAASWAREQIRDAPEAAEVAAALVRVVLATGPSRLLVVADPAGRRIAVHGTRPVRTAAAVDRQILDDLAAQHGPAPDGCGWAAALPDPAT